MPQTQEPWAPRRRPRTQEPWSSGRQRGQGEDAETQPKNKVVDLGTQADGTMKENDAAPAPPAPVTTEITAVNPGTLPPVMTETAPETKVKNKAAGLGTQVPGMSNNTNANWLGAETSSVVYSAKPAVVVVVSSARERRF